MEQDHDPGYFQTQSTRSVRCIAVYRWFIAILSGSELDFEIETSQTFIFRLFSISDQLILIHRHLFYFPYLKNMMDLQALT